MPTTFTVTSTADDGSVGTLRAALAAAANGDTIIFGPGLSGATITLDPNKGPLVITKAITINGSESGGQNVVISGGGKTGVFTVNGPSGGGLTTAIENLAIDNGNSTGAAGTLGKGGDAAGGILVNSGSLLLATDTFVGNNAVGGTSGLQGPGGNAAGAYYVEAGASVISAGLNFFGNTATGGAVGAGGTTPGIGYPITNACFCAGTMITTDRGDVAVEDLSIGDRVMTIDGTAEPIRWIGRRSFAGRFLAANPAVQPVIIRAGALGHALPRRDLRLSPCHAMFLDGILVPAGALVNGTSITVDHTTAPVDYFHIELAQHAVILAEGAASETFIDDDSRGMFQNAAEHAALYGDVARPAEFYARRVESGFELESIRARLAETAGEVALAA